MLKIVNVFRMYLLFYALCRATYGLYIIGREVGSYIKDRIKK